MTLSVAVARSKLESKLTSSLPLSKRCQLAVNLITSPVFIPGKESIILAWIFQVLDKKYNERNGDKSCEDDLELWKTLHRSITHLEKQQENVDIDWTGVAETLTNVLPHCDLDNETVLRCVTQLLTLSCHTTTRHEVMWACVITALLTHFFNQVTQSVSMVKNIYQILSSLELDMNQDYTELVISLSRLYVSHPDDSIKNVVGKLFFPSHDPYTRLFSHLTSCEDKYQPGTAVSLLLSVVTTPSSVPHTPPALIMSCCPTSPDWLRPKLCSFLLSSYGYPGIVSEHSIIGARILSAKHKPTYLAFSSFINEIFPCDISFQLSENQTFGQYLQDIARISLVRDGLTKTSSSLFKMIHCNHPQLLDPQLGLIMEKRLRNSSEDFNEVFLLVLDVAVKLRQLPKLVSKIFLHLRGVDEKTNLEWSKHDLSAFGNAVTSAPKVQCLEIWKMLNYHMSADLIESDCSDLAPVVTPLMSTVLTNVHLADHNTPSSLMPRIIDLVDSTLNNLKIVHKKVENSPQWQEVLVEITTSLHKMSSVIDSYRKLSNMGQVTSFAISVGGKMKENDSSNGKYLYLLYYQSLTTKPNFSSNIYDELLSNIQLNSSFAEDISSEDLLKLVKTNGLKISSIMLESLPLSSATLYHLVTKLNREEALFIPEYEHWNKSDSLKLDSYLGKSLSQAIISVIHNPEAASYKLSMDDKVLFSKLPLEYLPPSLNLASSLISLTFILNPSLLSDDLIQHVTRSLESTDIFRFIDAGMFLVKCVNLKCPEKIIEVLAVSAGKYTKSIIDVDRAMNQFEQLEIKSALNICLVLLGSLEKILTSESGGEDKLVACRSLANNIGTFASKCFKKRNSEDLVLSLLFCYVAAHLQNIFAKSGLGKLEKFINKVLRICLDEQLPNWDELLEATARNISYFEPSSLPENWKIDCTRKLCNGYSTKYDRLLLSLLKSASQTELDSMLKCLSEDCENILVWDCVIKSPMSPDCQNIKKEYVEIAVGNICTSDHSDTCPDHLITLLTSVFTSSPPCVSHLTEVTCIGLLTHIPDHLSHKSLSVLSSFISQRSNLSLSVIPITLSIIRRAISVPTPTLELLQSLGKVLGLFSRHKADYSPVVPFLVVDLLLFLQSLSLDLRGNLTSSIYPLLEMLEKHSFNYISTNLNPSTNELFKALLENYQANHKFKGKV